MSVVFQAETMNDLSAVVSACFAPKVREFFKENGLADPSRRLKFNSEERSVSIPIDGRKIQQLLCNLGVNEETNCKLILEYLESCLPGKVQTVKRMHLPPAKRLIVQKPKNCLKENLEKILKARGFDWTDEVVQDIPTHWEKHGDLVLLPASSFVHPVWQDIGTEFRECITSCLSCKRLARKDIISTSGYRTPQVHMLYGESSWVQHTDNGIKYAYDITKCMFSSGNITEKLRVAKFDCTGEVVVDLYAGIGYFTLPYLVYTNVKHLHACEWNPDAVEALHKNLMLNAVQDHCTVHEGDNRKVSPRGIADRVNLGLIPSSRDGWPVACAALKPQTGGTLHIHHNVNTTPLKQSCDQLLMSSKPSRDLFLTEARVQVSGTYQSDKNNLQNEKVCSYYSNGNGEVEVNETNGEIEKNETIDNICSRGQGYDESNSKTILLPDCDESLDFENPKLSAIGICDQPPLLVEKHTCNTGSEKQMAELEYKPESTESKDLNLDISEDIQNMCRINMPSSLSLQNRNNRITTCDNVSAYSKWLPWAQEVSEEIRGILQGLHGTEWKTNILHIEHVKSYAPHVDHVVLDLKCRPLNKPMI